MKRLSFEDFRSRAMDHGFIVAPFHNPPDLWSIAMEMGRREEREACAKLCEELTDWHSDGVVAAFESAAENIRARGEGQ